MTDKVHPLCWQSFLSIYIDLSDEKIIRFYGKRWDIEVFFKMTRQHRNLENGFQARNFDSIIPHTTKVMTRYVLVKLPNIRHGDPRTPGFLSQRYFEDLKNLAFIEALRRVQPMLLDTLKKAGWWLKEP